MNTNDTVARIAAETRALNLRDEMADAADDDGLDITVVAVVQNSKGLPTVQAMCVCCGRKSELEKHGTDARLRVLTFLRTHVCVGKAAEIAAQVVEDRPAAEQTEKATRRAERVGRVTRQTGAQWVYIKQGMEALTGQTFDEWVRAQAGEHGYVPRRYRATATLTEAYKRGFLAVPENGI